jgi:hypothetical protein
VVAAAFGVAIEAIPPRRIKPLGLFGAALITFMVAGAYHISTGYENAEAAYAGPQIVANTTIDEWQRQRWKQLPARRIDLAGKPEEVFSAQLAGNLESFNAAMTAEGWIATPKWTWRDSIPYLNPNAKLVELQPRPALHEGLKAKLTMILPDPGNPEQRQVLRAYQTDLQATGGLKPQPIYLVSLKREYRKKGFILYAMPSTLDPTIADESALRAGFQTAPELKMVGEKQVEGKTQLLMVTLP